MDNILLNKERLFHPRLDLSYDIQIEIHYITKFATLNEQMMSCDISLLHK